MNGAHKTLVALAMVAAVILSGDAGRPTVRVAVTPTIEAVTR